MSTVTLSGSFGTITLWNDAASDPKGIGIWPPPPTMRRRIRRDVKIPIGDGIIPKDLGEAEKTFELKVSYTTSDPRNISSLWESANGTIQGTLGYPIQGGTTSITNCILDGPPSFEIKALVNDGGNTRYLIEATAVFIQTH